MKSENIGGLVSMAGSCLFLLGGDLGGVIVSLSFLAAEIILARRGHVRSGYSAGCALFAFGDAIAVFSVVAQGNRIFQLTLGVMAAVWLIGAMRSPLAWLGERHKNPRLIAVADALQPVVGVTTLLLRVPGIISAVVGGSYLGATAVLLWALSDVLVGRLQDFVRKRPSA